MENLMGSVTIQLRNGRRLQAVPQPDGTYGAVLASGKVKFYAEMDIRVVNNMSIAEEELTAPNQINKKEDVVIYHYLINNTNKQTTERFVSTVIPDRFKEDYERSVATRRASGHVLAINSGAYNFHILEWELIRSGVNFTLMTMSHEDLAKYSVPEVRGMVDRSAFAWANASAAFFIKNLERPGEWGLDFLDMDITFKKKSAKRAQEIARLSDMSLVIESDDDMPSMLILDGDDLPGDITYYDGMSYIRKSLALRMARGCKHPQRRSTLIRDINSGKLTRIGFRFLTPSGLIKGDATIVPDHQIDYDIITHAENIKSELVTRTRSYMTGWEHSPYHLAVWDDQSTINFRYGLSERKQVADINRIKDSFMDSLERGEIPNWITLSPPAHNDDGTPNWEKLSKTISHQWEVWQFAGLDIKAAQNPTFMALEGVIKRMKTEKRHGFYSKLWIPMTNAGLFAINTYESCTEMGGFTFPGRDKNLAFFDPRVGLVMPGKRFQETFDLHGTWDLDDSVKGIWIKLFSSDGDYEIHKGKTLPANIKLPNKAEDAIDMLLLVRSPNGPGEYSIEFFDPRGMFDLEMVDMDNIDVVDMAQMPLPQTEMLKVIDLMKIPNTTDYHGGPIERDDAFNMIMAQSINPGVGSYCNPIMVWANATMGRSFPPKMLDVMGEVVDALQQGFDAEAFSAIADETSSVIQQLSNLVESDSNIKVDTSIAYTRMSSKQRSMIKGGLVKGRFTRVQKHYAETIEFVYSQLRNKTMQWRKETDIINRVGEMRFGKSMAEWSKNFHTKYTIALAAADTEFKVDPEDSPFLKMHMQQMHKEKMESIVAEMVGVFNSMPTEESYRHVLGLWKWIVLFNHGTASPHGLSDRIIFQPGGTGNPSVMHILIEALKHEGLI